MSTKEKPYVRRGGSWIDFQDFARAAFRFRNLADYWSGSIGFRVLQSRENDEPRILRGGSWYSSPDYARKAERVRLGADYGDNDIGFRVLSDPPPKGDPPKCPTQ